VRACGGGAVKVAAMNSTEQLQAWGVAHAEARRAEAAARQGGHAQDADDLQRQAKLLRERADHLHREVYHALGRRSGDRPG
jgi:hypothetical protein